MNRLLLFRIVCVVVSMVSVIALGLEVFQFHIRSMAVIYVWAGLAIAGLFGNAVGACFAVKREKESGR